MSNNKQTAVAWLYKKLAEILCDVEVNAVQAIALFDTLKQAKEMEKQQIEDAWYAGDEDGAIHEFEYYYTQVYGGETMMTTGENNNTNNNPGNSI